MIRWRSPVRHGVNWTLPLHWPHSTSHPRHAPRRHPQRNEFYSHHYLAEIFAGDIQAALDRWREQAESANARTPWAELRALAPEHLRFRRDFERERRAGQRILRQREWFRLLLAALGFSRKPANLALEDGAEVPILWADGEVAGAPRLLALGAFDATGEGEDPSRSSRAPCSSTAKRRRRRPC